MRIHKSVLEQAILKVKSMSLQEKEATGISWVYMGCQLSDVAAESLSRHAAENDQTTRALRLNLDDFDDNSKSAAKILRDAGHGE